MPHAPFATAPVELLPQPLNEKRRFRKTIIAGQQGKHPSYRETVIDKARKESPRQKLGDVPVDGPGQSVGDIEYLGAQRGQQSLPVRFRNVPQVDLTGGIVGGHGLTKTRQAGQRLHGAQTVCRAKQL